MTESQSRRIAISVEYDGTGYRGWQEQRHDVRSVQAVVQNAISKIADEPIHLICAGRTDSGVHASSQVCHFDTHAIRESYNWVMGTNTELPKDVSLCWAHDVAKEFHARFLATSRQYVYLIRCSSFRSALLTNTTTFTSKKLDPHRMAEAGAHLLGSHNFNGYRSVQCQAKNPCRTLMGLAVHVDDEFIAVHVEANSFLQNMVRNIVGVLMAIGSGEKSTLWARDVLESKDRTQGGVTAPPQGLYFLGPTYPDTINLPQTVRIPTIIKRILKTNPVQ